MRADSAERRAALPSGVYFVQSGAFVKIGHASDVVQRVAQAGHAWNPHEVTPLGWLPAPDDRAAFQLERRLHIQFAAHRYRCEWFHAHESLLAFIVAHAQPWPTPEPRG